jgi:hypothetical protein
MSDPTYLHYMEITCSEYMRSFYIGATYICDNMFFHVQDLL